MRHSFSFTSIAFLLGVHAHVSTGWDDEVRCPEAGLRRIFGAHGCDSPFHSPAQRFLLRGLARIYVQGRLMRYDVQRMDGWALSAHTGATFIFTHKHSVFIGRGCMRIWLQDGMMRYAAQRRSRRAFPARTGATFIVTRQPCVFYWGIVCAHRYNVE